MNNTQAAVQVWVGQSAVIAAAAIEMVQRSVLSCDGCRICAACIRIVQRQSPYLYWRVPQGSGYTRDQIEEAFAPLAFAVEEHEIRFLIIESAEQCLPAAAQSMLKILEEPPRGWHIILLCERPALLLPTIRSRCIERAFTETVTAEQQYAFVAWLCDPKKETWSTAIASVEQMRKNAVDVLPLLDHIMCAWHGKDSSNAHHIKQIILDAYHHLPGPGGAMQFWRSLMISVRSLML